MPDLPPSHSDPSNLSWRGDRTDAQRGTGFGEGDKGVPTSQGGERCACEDGAVHFKVVLLRRGRNEHPVRTLAARSEASVQEPDRKEQILSAAAELVSASGYHAVSMSEIGAAAGITGPAIYRHFPSKSAVLVALFDRAIDRLLDEAQEIARLEVDPEQSLRELIVSQVRFVVVDRSVAQVYYSENQSLPEDDRRRLRRKQRLYLEEWVHVLTELRPDSDEAETRVVVHAAIGAIQSSLFHAQGPIGSRLDRLLAEVARAVLGIGAAGSDGKVSDF